MGEVMLTDQPASTFDHELLLSIILRAFERKENASTAMTLTRPFWL